MRKEPIKRALRTFFQAGSTYILAHIVADDFSSKEAVMALIVSTLAAGLAAVMNMDWNHVNY